MRTGQHMGGEEILEFVGIVVLVGVALSVVASEAVAGVEAE